MGLLRYQIFLGYAFAFISVWLVALRRKEEIVDSVVAALSSQADSSDAVGAIANAVVDFMPILAVVAFGLYALLLLVVGVIRFEDVPEAAKELETHVAEAKEEMRKRKLNFGYEI